LDSIATAQTKAPGFLAEAGRFCLRDDQTVQSLPGALHVVQIYKYLVENSIRICNHGCNNPGSLRVVKGESE